MRCVLALLLSAVSMAATPNRPAGLTVDGGR